MKMRSEYVDLIEQLEGNNDISVTWKSSNKPCLPTVSHTNKNLFGEKKLSNDQECSLPLSPISYDTISRQVSQEKELVVDSKEGDMISNKSNSTENLNSCMSDTHNILRENVKNPEDSIEVDNHEIPDVEDLNSRENLNLCTNETDTQLCGNVKNTEDNVLNYLQEKKTGDYSSIFLVTKVK